MKGWVDLGCPAMYRPGVELAISRSQVRRPNHYTTKPAIVTPCLYRKVPASRRHLGSASRHHLVVPRHNLSTYGRRAFAVAGPAAWNSLSDDLCDPALSIDSFRRLLNTHLFSEY